MTNEEPVPSTSSVLSAAEKNVKIEPPQSSKKRKGLDIDALWRKKFKDVENQKSPEKPQDDKSSPSSSESKGGPPEEGTSSSETSSEVKEEETEVEKPEVSVKSETAKTITSTPTRPTRKPQPQQEAPKPAPPPREPSPVGRTTRSARKKTEAVKKGMNDLEDVKPNIKLLKKSLPGFQCSNLNDGTVGDSVPTNNNMMDAQKLTLHRHHHHHQHDELDIDGYEESQDEMDVMQRSGDDSNADREDYEYGMEYANAVTPNGTYTIYGPDATYTQYYPYGNNNMQSSPQEANGTQYLVQAPQSPISNEDPEAAILQSNQRASPATVNWLFENYEIAEGSSLPRCQLYDHYKKHCEEHRMDPVNAASFGKLIRSVFQNLKTRRLGTRGNSKYHYYGIRMKDSSVLHSIPVQPQPPLHQQVYTPPMQHIPQRDAYADTVNQVAAQKYMHSDIPMKRSRKERSSSSSTCRESPSPNLDLPNHNTSFLDSTPEVVPTQVPINNLPKGPYTFTEKDKASLGKQELTPTPFKDFDAFIAHQNFRKFDFTEVELNSLIESYEYLCQEVLNCVKQIKFAEVDELWSKFWSGDVPIGHENLLAMCAIERIQDWIIEVDLKLYQTIVDCLIPHVLLSELSAGMTQSCRTFGKNIDVNLKKSLAAGGLSEMFIKKKIQAITYMQHGLKRYTSLNHLAHAARGVLMKPEQCSQMYIDFNKVDIDAVHQQAGWICNCDRVMVHSISTAFKTNLHKASGMDRWAEWLESIVDQVLAKYHDRPYKEVENVGKQFLLNWSFYTSMIIRDLTLRSALSFGSFTLIRLLADDYMYYLIESKIAKAANLQLITVIRQDKEWPLAKTSQEYIVPSKDEPVDVVDKNGIS